MKMVYIVENVNPDLRVFMDYKSAFEFAVKKADKRKGPTDVWFEGVRVYRTSEYCSGENHIYIHAREIENND